MTKIEIKKENVAQFHNFMNYVKRMESVYPLNDKQLFVIDSTNSRISLYAEGKSAAGGAGVIHSDVDASITLDFNQSDYFVSDITQIVSALSKIKDQDVEIRVDDKKLEIISTTNKTNIKIALFVSKTKQEVDETKSYIQDQLNSDIFKNSIIVQTGKAYSDLVSFASLGKVLSDQTKVIQVNADMSQIKFADRLCIANWQDGQKTNSEEVFIDNALLPIIKGLESITYSKDKKSCYFKIPENGIEVMYSLKDPDWGYPTNDDLLDITADPSNQYAVLINGDAFYQSLEKFEGLFQSNCWRYNQIKFNTTDIKNNKELFLHFDDMAVECNDYLPVTVQNTGIEDGFEFLFPSIYMPAFKKLLEGHEFLLVYNGISEDQPHGCAIEIISGNLKIVIAKLIE